MTETTNSGATISHDFAGLVAAIHEQPAVYRRVSFGANGCPMLPQPDDDTALSDFVGRWWNELTEAEVLRREGRFGDQAMQYGPATAEDMQGYLFVKDLQSPALVEIEDCLGQCGEPQPDDAPTDYDRLIALRGAQSEAAQLMYEVLADFIQNPSWQNRQRLTDLLHFSADLRERADDQQQTSVSNFMERTRERLVALGVTIA